VTDQSPTKFNNAGRNTTRVKNQPEMHHIDRSSQVHCTLDSGRSGNDTLKPRHITDMFEKGVEDGAVLALPTESRMEFHGASCFVLI